MITKPMDVLSSFPVRKTRKQKQSFRDAIASYASAIGYTCNIEKGMLGSKNIIIGDPGKARYLITAHYDTPAWLPFPNLITPCNFIAFLGYQLFIVTFMIAIMFAFGLAAYLLTQNEQITVLSTYCALWLFLIFVYAGPANRHNCNDNTSGVITVLETAANLPPEYQDRVCFVLFDLEEAGLLGSASYQSKHKKQTQNQLVLNVDCVGDGNEILMFPTGKVRKNKVITESLYGICGSWREKSVALRAKGFSVYPSDQSNFPYGVGVAAFRRSNLGLYLGRIHTHRDTVLEEENVIILRNCLTKLIAGTDELRKDFEHESI